MNADDDRSRGRGLDATRFETGLRHTQATPTLEARRPRSTITFTSFFGETENRSSSSLRKLTTSTPQFTSSHQALRKVEQRTCISWLDLGCGFDFSSYTLSFFARPSSPQPYKLNYLQHRRSPFHSHDQLSLEAPTMPAISSSLNSSESEHATGMLYACISRLAVQELTDSTAYIGRPTMPTSSSNPRPQARQCLALAGITSRVLFSPPLAVSSPPDSSYSSAMPSCVFLS